MRQNRTSGLFALGQVTVAAGSLVFKQGSRPKLHKGRHFWWLFLISDHSNGQMFMSDQLDESWTVNQCFFVDPTAKLFLFPSSLTFWWTGQHGHL